MFLRDQIKGCCSPHHSPAPSPLQNYSRYAHCKAPSASDTLFTVYPCTSSFILRNINVLHCQKPLLWLVKGNLPRMAAFFCIIGHIVPQQIWHDGGESACLRTWKGREKRWEMGTEGHYRPGGRWGTEAYGSCLKKERWEPSEKR